MARSVFNSTRSATTETSAETGQTSRNAVSTNKIVFKILMRTSSNVVSSDKRQVRASRNAVSSDKESVGYAGM